MRVVIIGVRSRTHLIHIAAYLRAQLDVGETIEAGYVGGGVCLGHASVSERDVLFLLPDSDRLRVTFVTGVDRWRWPAAEPITYVSVGALGIKPWIALRRGKIFQLIHTVVTDEGVGTYGDWRTHRDAWRRQGVREPWTTVRALAGETAARTLTTTRWAMYDERRAWALHPQIAQEFRRHVGAVRPDPTGDRVLFLSSPWVELGLLSAERYLAHVRAVRARVVGDGKQLIIRPHPSEDRSRYAEFEMIEGELPAEVDPQVVAAAAVIGGASTALLNLVALYDLPAMRVVTPGLEYLESKLGVRQRALLTHYLPVIDNVAG